MPVQMRPEGVGGGQLQERDQGEKKMELTDYLRGLTEQKIVLRGIL